MKFNVYFFHILSEKKLLEKKNKKLNLNVNESQSKDRIKNIWPISKQLIGLIQEIAKSIGSRIQIV